MKRIYEVLGYETKEDFEGRNQSLQISGTGLDKKEAIEIAKSELKSGNWYAVKFQSSDREEIEILYRKNEWSTKEGEIYAEDGVTIARCTSICDLQAEVNADRIVTCVNSHDELVAALEGMINLFKDFTDEAKYKSGIAMAKEALRVAKYS